LIAKLEAGKIDFVVLRRFKTIFDVLERMEVKSKLSAKKVIFHAEVVGIPAR